MEQELLIPNKEEFMNYIREFEKHEKRDAMYKVSMFIINSFWGNPKKVTDGLGVLLLTWNQAFYRYGLFDFDKLEECIKRNSQKLEEFRNRDILNLSQQDEESIKILFNDFLDALKISSGKKAGNKSPVSVAKALHLLAPKFFPLWDDRIARAYMCYYSKDPEKRYIDFCKLMKKIAEKIKNFNIENSDKTILKLIDEYNYAKYTKLWKS